MTERISELLNEAVAGVEPAHPDPVGAVHRRGASGRTSDAAVPRPSRDQNVTWRGQDATVRRLLTLLLLVPAAGLAACTPADEPIAALAVRAGEPIGLLYACEAMFSQFSVYENSDSDDPGVHISWSVHGDVTAGTVVEVPLLGDDLPDGWEVSEPRDLTAEEAGLAVDVEPLTSLEPGMRYVLGGDNRRGSLPIDFTVDDFAGLSEDTVLVHAGRDKTRTVSRATFVERARDTC
jgi:hypothetical protein